MPETIESGSRAARRGRLHLHLPDAQHFAHQRPGDLTSYIVEKARRNAIVNVYPIGAITKDSAGEELAAIGSMKEAGVVAISDDGRP